MGWLTRIICLLRKARHLSQRAFGPIPPRGDPPTNEQNKIYLKLFPRLTIWSVTGPSSNRYNCIAWSVSITNQWFWPGDTIQAFDAFYASHGWTVSNTCIREYKKRKIALFASDNGGIYCQHASRETRNYRWHESKAGKAERIMHLRTDLEGGAYGNIVRCYEKQDNKANLDLCSL